MRPAGCGPVSACSTSRRLRQRLHPGGGDRGDVVASDLTPSCSTRTHHRGARGVELAWVQGDAEALPYGDGASTSRCPASGDVRAAPRERRGRAAARTAPAGPSPDQLNPPRLDRNLFKTMGPFAPPPPPGATPPPRWGDEAARPRAVRGPRRRRGPRAAPRRPTSPTRWSSASTGSATINCTRSTPGDPERVAQLDRDFLEFLTAWNDNGAYEAEYLVVTARKPVVAARGRGRQDRVEVRVISRSSSGNSGSGRHLDTGHALLLGRHPAHGPGRAAPATAPAGPAPCLPPPGQPLHRIEAVERLTGRRMASAQERQELWLALRARDVSRMSAEE